MKILIWFFLSFNGFLLMASELPNSGHNQNDYGFYGEGVVFGNYEITGSWNLCEEEIAIFDNNAISSSHIGKYGV